MQHVDRRSALRWLALPVAAGVLTACGKQPAAFKGTDITGSGLGMTVALTDHTGRRRTLADFRGKVVAVFFGYTHCPDVCPTTLGDLKVARQQLGAEDAQQVQVLFVTVDPERDTQQALSQYVPAFDASFLGLRGTPEELKTLAGQMKFFYARANQTGSDYTMDHQAAVYLFDRQGRIRVLETNVAGPATLVEDMRKLLRES